MQEKDIKNILTDTYDFEKWHRVIDFVFPNVNFENSIVQLDDTRDVYKRQLFFDPITAIAVQSIL